MQVSYTKTKETSKGARLWFEGLRLKQLGFDKGDRYDLEMKENSIQLKSNPNGKYIVSGRKRNKSMIPIVDIQNNKIKEIFGADTHLRVKISNNIITVEPHKVEIAKIDRERILLSKLLKGEILNKGTLCSGIGVSTHALEEGLKAGGIKSRTDLLFDIEGKYLDISIKNAPDKYKNTNIIHGELEFADFRDIPKLDILNVSLPCTGHSPAGKTSNKIKIAEQHNEAATAVLGFLDIVKWSNPSIIVSENVTQAQDSATYYLIRAELNRLGYEIHEKILGKEEGACIEKRNRYWFVAISKGLKGFKFEEFPSFTQKYKTVGELIEKDDDSFFSPEKFLAREEENKKKNRGFKTNFIDDSVESIGVIPRTYAKRQVSNPHYIKNGLVRLFTPNEHARLKGVPERLVKDVSKTTAHEGLGQGILYNHAYGIGQIIAQWLKKGGGL